MHELHPNVASENGKRNGEGTGRKNIESGLLARLRTTEHQSLAGRKGGKVGGKRTHALYPTQSSKNGKITTCSAVEHSQGQTLHLSPTYLSSHRFNHALHSRPRRGERYLTPERADVLRLGACSSGGSRAMIYFVDLLRGSVCALIDPVSV
jgi:hypothetical protein